MVKQTLNAYLSICSVLLLLAGCSSSDRSEDDSETPTFEGVVQCSGPDADGDRLPDCQETIGWLVSVDFDGLGEPLIYTVTSDPSLADTDGDGLDDYQEFLDRTDAQFADTDGDGLDDREELEVYTSNPTSVDSDGDTLRDGREVFQFRTSPTLTDTEGDGVTDDVELATTGFSPLVAELPKLEIFVSTAPTLSLNATISSGATTYNASLESREEAVSRGGSDSTEATKTNSQSISTEIEGSPFPPSVSAKVSAEANWSSSTTSTRSSSWSADSTAASQQEFQRSVEESAEFDDGTINVGFTIVNQGEKSVTLNNLKIAVLKRNVFNYNQFPRLITELVPKEGASSEFDIANGASKGPLLATDTEVPALVMQNLLADPRGLEFVVSSFDFTDPNRELNYTAISESAVARTALVVIDYGDGRIERYMVATSVKRDASGNSVGLTMAEVMEILQIPYTTVLQSRGGTDRTVLESVRDVSIESAVFTTWFVASSSDSVVDPSINFEDIVVKSRDVIQLSFEKDTDGDKLIDRHEMLYGTDIDVQDTDGDGIGDGDEVIADTDPLGVVANANALNLTGDTITLAGNGNAGSDDGIGENATLNRPTLIEYAGNAIYFADTGGHVIRRLDLSTNAVTTLAGSPGDAGFADGVGPNARFNQPFGIAVDETHMYIADTTNNAIRKMSLVTLEVTTLAGNAQAPAPPACPSIAVDGSSAVATFSGPIGIELVGAFLYVSDSTSGLVRRVDKVTGRTSTVAGFCTVGPPWSSVDGFGANARFNRPTGIVSDGINLFVAEVSGDRIRKVRISNGAVTTLVGEAGVGAVDGDAAVAQFNNPNHLVSDGTYLWVSDSANNAIRRVDKITGFTETLTGQLGGAPGFAEGTGALFNSPEGITSDGIFLYVGDANNNRIRRIR